MPGKMVQCLKSVGTANPLVLIDEIDKVFMLYIDDSVGDHIYSVVVPLFLEYGEIYLYVIVKYVLRNSHINTSAGSWEGVMQVILQVQCWNSLIQSRMQIF